MEDAIALSKEGGRGGGQTLRPARLPIRKSATAPHESARHPQRRVPKLAEDNTTRMAARFRSARRHPTAETVAIGARMPLIAYNINLNAPSLEIAHDIAKKIRFIGSGLHFF